jgi:type I restriction enzyme M protein
MITGALKSKIDKLWLEFHSGGITNPLTVIEQISYLVFARMLDMREMAAEKRASRTGKKGWKRIFPRNRSHLRWSHLINLGAEEQLRIVLGNRTKDDPEDWKGLFQFFREEVVNGTTLGNYLRDAQCAIQKPGLLKTAINTVNELPLSLGDTKGDLYEYLLSKLTTAGVAGQFRTPRHIIRAMVEMLDVKPDETVCDPACGTGGFLIETMEYLKRTHTSKELIHEEVDEETGEPVTDDHGNPIMIYAGDQLDEYRSHIEKDMFHGFDFDSTMLRIAAMNMMLHGIDSPCIEYKDSLSEQSQVAQEYEGSFDVVLANPPFKGSIDHESVFKGLTSVAKTKKTELLFLVLMTRLLKNGGRCAVIVPDGVLFGSSTAHRAVRRMLIEENQLEGVVSLPSGVFKPYAGVSTAVLIFTKGGRTDNVWFYRVENDGYSLDDKRVAVTDDDLPDLVSRWRGRDPGTDTDRTQGCFFVTKLDIVRQKYDLSFKRYAETAYVERACDPPKTILKKLRTLENDISKRLSALEGLLK